MRAEKTEQEKFWESDFGDEYIKRNCDESLVRFNEAFFARLFRHMAKISSVIEFGANIGLNIMAIRNLLPEIHVDAIETNATAAIRLKEINDISVHHKSIHDFTPHRQWDLALAKTVLIHIPPDMLPAVYDLLYKSSNRYICIAEYYSTSPVEVEYRGHRGKLFKRDFAGEMLDRYPDLQLLDYGFLYHRDSFFPHDDINWFLLERI
jgi:spore coat polysaccharide biosynthesis protein SpsF